jgi:hypothetical protein
LNFEFLSVLNHDNVTWGCPKGGRSKEEEDYYTHNSKKVREAVGTL